MPDPSIPTLVQRARDSLKQYVTFGDDIESNMTDLLTDLRHLADTENIDFHGRLDSSYNHYLAEKNGD